MWWSGQFPPSRAACPLGAVVLMSRASVSTVCVSGRGLGSAAAAAVLPVVPAVQLRVSLQLLLSHGERLARGRALRWGGGARQEPQCLALEVSQCPAQCPETLHIRFWSLHDWCPARSCHETVTSCFALLQLCPFSGCPPWGFCSASAFSGLS